jgi:hypothetical protein
MTTNRLLCTLLAGWTLAGCASAQAVNTQLERCDKTLAVRSYKAQSVEGGLGNGGKLQVN